MKQTHLHIVGNETQEKQRAAAAGIVAQMDLLRLQEKWRDWFTMTGVILLVPFRLIATIWRIGVATSVGLIHGFFRFFLGLFGILVICMICVALIRVVFYPLFH